MTEATQVTMTKKRRLSRVTMWGPAFVAAVAYVDPGNFATNFAGGSEFGYRLLWVIVAANLMAMLVQTLSAKLGLASGRDLAEQCRENFPRPVVWFLWFQAELVAIATDLAEVIGGAVALNLLFGIPPWVGGLITGLVAFVLLGLETRGYRRFELAIGGLLAVIFAGFMYNLVRAGLDVNQMISGLKPGFAPGSVLLATGILGATVMPHVIYLHSSLTAGHMRRHGQGGIGTGDEVGLRRRLLGEQRMDTLLALSIAGLVNLSMLIIAAQLFVGRDISTLESVHSALGTALGSFGALAFALALLASGFASSSVGTYAGQVVMAGFLQMRIPLMLRRSITLAPALVVLALGIDPTAALVMSQVVLSFGIPFALFPLIWLTAQRRIMGVLANPWWLTGVALLIGTAITALNAKLLLDLI
ncbi:divalent metal cation transporter MntH [Pseudonocardiaceae bacterium YIM PH 21723]|nr:divalent metal cation transporter MntH [Pseudonocardiaceae bacterium YIM PH 21723]